MKLNLPWSFKQLYLLYFQPTRFRRDVDSAHSTLSSRLKYMLRILPLNLMIVICCNLVLGYLCQLVWKHYNWQGSWAGVVSAVIVGLVSGAWSGVDIGVMSSIVGGVGGSVVAGVALGVGGNIAWWAKDSMIIGIELGIVLGMGFGIGLSVVGGARGSMTFGVVTGMMISLGFSVVGGIVFGGTFFIEFFMIFVVAYAIAYFRLFAYPIDCCLAAFAWNLHKRNVLYAWKICPVNWNEVVWLPIPFCGRLLALVTQENRVEGLHLVAFVMAERPLQRRVALAALEEVVLGDLKADALAGIMGVQERMNWMAATETVVPDTFRAAWPRFERVAQSVEQYHTLHNAFRKAEALQRTVQEIKGLQGLLIGEHSRFAARLLLVANGWSDLVLQEQKALAALSEAACEIPNPFVFGRAVPEVVGTAFVGRRDIVMQIERSVLGSAYPPTLLLYGPRRMGKTSILNQLPRLLGSDFGSVTVDCQNPAVRESLAALLRYLSRTLCDGLQRQHVTIEPLTAASLAQDPYTVFDEWLDSVEKAMPANLRVVLCLDEYERLQETLDAGWGTTFLDALRHMLQHRPRIALMFTGAHTFAEMGSDWTDRFISVRRMQVSFLSREDLYPLLMRPLPEFDMTYVSEPNALEALLDATNGHPFLTQAVAYELVEYMNSQQRKQATCDDVEAAIVAALVSGGEYFANVWTDMSVEEQVMVRAIAHGEAVPDNPKARARLREHDILNAEGGFAVPMVERWVRENI